MSSRTKSNDKAKSRTLTRPHRVNRNLLALAIVVMVGLGYFAVARSHASGLKAQIGGLVDRGAAPATSSYGTVNSFIVQVNWSALQGTNGANPAGNNAIDQAITYVRQQNAAHPGLKMGLKIRVLGGINAPDWAKAIGGAALPNICDINSSPAKCGSVGRFWTPEYEAAYAGLQNKLAAAYDGVPEVLDNVIAGCATVYDEPMIRQINDAPSVQQFRDAGYTVAADQQCQRAQIDAHKVWIQTRSSLAFNPYQVINPSATTTDVIYTNSLIDYCRSTLGSRCVLGNNSVSKAIPTGDMATMYAKIKSMGAPIYFQTATVARISSITAVLSWAVSEGAGMVELPTGYVAAYTIPTLSPYNPQLLSQAVGAVAPPTPTPTATPTPISTPTPSATQPSTPTPTVSPGGTGPTPTLTNLPPSGQPVAGQVNLGSSATVTVDGNIVSTSGLLDTTQLTNGSHTVTVIEDGRTTTRTILVSNKLSPWQTINNQVLAAFHGNRLATLGAIIIIIVTTMVGLGYAITFGVSHRVLHEVVLSKLR